MVILKLNIQAEKENWAINSEYQTEIRNQTRSELNDDHEIMKSRSRISSQDSLHSNPKTWLDFEQENRTWRVSRTWRNPISDVETVSTNGSKFGINIFFSRSTSMEMEIKKFLPQIQILYHQVLFLTDHLRYKRSADIKIWTLRQVSKLMVL